MHIAQPAHVHGMQSQQGARHDWLAVRTAIVALYFDAKVVLLYNVQGAIGDLDADEVARRILERHTRPAVRAAHCCSLTSPSQPCTNQAFDAPCKGRIPGQWCLGAAHNFGQSALSAGPPCSHSDHQHARALTVYILYLLLLWDSDPASGVTSLCKASCCPAWCCAAQQGRADGAGWV
jgi:hypothetical protein